MALPPLRRLSQLFRKVTDILQTNSIPVRSYLPIDIQFPGFNMGWDLATLVTWGAFLVDGNHLTNLMSIGQKSTQTGRNPPSPAIVGGLNTHGVFEGGRECQT